MKIKQPIHPKREYSNIREVIEHIGDIYHGKVAYSYRIKPSDKEIIEKKYDELRDDVRALASELIARDIAGKHIALVGKLSVLG